MRGASYTLVSGDPMAPSSSDLIACTVHLPNGQTPPAAEYDCWRVLTGGPKFNLWGRLAYRYEIERG